MLFIVDRRDRKKFRKACSPITVLSPWLINSPLSMVLTIFRLTCGGWDSPPRPPFCLCLGSSLVSTSSPRCSTAGTSFGLSPTTPPVWYRNNFV